MHLAAEQTLQCDGTSADSDESSDQGAMPLCKTRARLKALHAAERRRQVRGDPARTTAWALQPGASGVAGPDIGFVSVAGWGRWGGGY